MKDFTIALALVALAALGVSTVYAVHKLRVDTIAPESPIMKDLCDPTRHQHLPDGGCLGPGCNANTACVVQVTP